MIPAAEVPRGEELCVRFPNIIGITCCGSERGCILSFRKGLNRFTCFIAECAAVNEPVRNNGSQVEQLNGVGGGFLHNGFGFGFVKLNMRHVEALSVCEPNMLVGVRCVESYGCRIAGGEIAVVDNVAAVIGVVCKVALCNGVLCVVAEAGGAV